MDSRVVSLVGSSLPLQELKSDIRQAAASDARVLVVGETGTGKEVATRLIHAAGRRAAHPFVAINCAGLAETLLESELFGHNRGSFTGAVRDKPGLLERAHLGTVFFDEVGEMSSRMQGLLLRFLETGEIQPVGAERGNIRVDVRVIAATNRNLAERVAEGAFRLDLFYRLEVIELRTPALRDRREDIPELLRHFLTEYAARYQVVPPAIDPDALARLQGYSWPGNVRQLKNLVERLVVRTPERITVDHLPREMKGGVRAAPAAAPRPDALADRALDRMLSLSEPFWSAVYAPFMSRDLTRDDVRAVVSKGLELTRGSYTALVQLFNMPSDDYKRLLNFLRKHQCQIGYQQFRSVPRTLDQAADHHRLVSAG
jgi:transcriptional regulator with PAS, ATPase and Fis domain